MVSYGKIFKDDSGCVYSIDNFICDYTVAHRRSFVFETLAEEVFLPAVPGWELERFSKVDLPACATYSWFKSSIWGGGFYIQYGQYRDHDKVTGDWTEYPLLRVKFNPNKYWASPVLPLLLKWLREHTVDGESLLVKFDFAVDVPARLCDIEVRSRKEPGLYKGTRYYGQRNKHGRLKIYDKKTESNLPDDITRVEWTFCHGKPIVFDDVFWLTNGPAPLPDAKTLGKSYALARVLLDIRALGGDVRQALSYFDYRTARKLEPYTMGTGVRFLDCCPSQLRSLLEFYCDALRCSFKSVGANEIAIGNSVSRFSMDDLEDDSLPF